MAFSKVGIQEAYHKGFLQGYQRGYYAGLHDRPPQVHFEHLQSIPIEAIGLSSRAYHCLHFSGCITVADVVRLKEAEIQQIRNLGKKTASEVALALNAIGVRATAWDYFLPEPAASPRL